MSTYKIKSSTLNRLAGVCSFFESSTDEETKAKINTVRLENKNGKTLAIVSNQKIGVIEYLGETDEADGSEHIILSPELLQQLTVESSSDCMITITTIPEMAISTLQSTSGFNMSNCCYLWDDTPLKDWRGWGVNPADSNSGIMFWNLNYIETLIKSSPSNNVIFPEFIDITIPVVLRDYHNPDWVGIFFAQPPGDVKVTKPADLPEWWEE